MKIYTSMEKVIYPLSWKNPLHENLGKTHIIIMTIFFWSKKKKKKKKKLELVEFPENIIP
jgi:hypothetical protein